MADLADRIRSAVAEWQERLRVPGVGYALLEDGRSHVEGFGITNADHPLPVDGRTLFQIASITKTFTATALMRLEDEGRLELDSPVVRILPEFRIPDEARSAEVRVEDLLTHMGGWDGDFFFIRAPEDPNLESLVAGLPAARQLVPLRSQWSYNNAGFSVAGRVLEVVAGMPYTAAIRELLLEPLGLDHTFFLADEAITHRVAAGHVVGKQGPVVLRSGGWQPRWELLPSDHPAGGLVSCAEDLLHWTRFHLGDGSVSRNGSVPMNGGVPDADDAAGEEPTRLLRRETLGRMRRPLHSRGNDFHTMGLGWLLARHGEVETFGHGGNTVGYLSEITLVAEPAFALVLLTNAVHGAHLLREVRDVALAEAVGADVAPPPPMTDPPDDLSAYAGLYDAPFWLQRVRAGDAPGELVIDSEARPWDPERWQPPPPPPSALRLYAPDRAVVTAPEGSRGALCEFGRDAAGEVVWLRSGLRIAPKLDSPDPAGD
ncbi:MAG: serine hydrolase domain-containing protein [Myxococcota bacterium]|nr:serine hydrolase domain-containing protein [Myxococcota bacterium]